MAGDWKGKQSTVSLFTDRKSDFEPVVLVADVGPPVWDCWLYLGRKCGICISQRTHLKVYIGMELHVDLT